MRAVRVLPGGPVARVARWSFAGTAVASLTGIMTARLLGPGERGTLALVLSIAGTAVLIGAMGSNVAIRVHLPKADRPGVRAYASLSARLLLALLLVLVGVAFLTAALVDPAFGAASLGAAFVVYGVLFFTSNQALDLLNAEGRVSRSAQVNTLGSCVTCVGVAAAVALHGGIVFVVNCYSAGALLQTVCCTLLAARVHDPQGLHPVRTLWITGLRLMGLNLGQALTYTSDRVVLGALSSPSEVGQYAVAVTPAGLLRIPANALGQVTFHRVAKGSTDMREIRRDIIRLEVVLLALAIAGCLLARPVLLLVFGSDYSGAVGSFRVLLFAEVALAPFLVLARVLAGLERTWAASTCGLTGFVLLMAACFALIPLWGAEGAAVASLVAYAGMSGVAALLVRRHNAWQRRQPQP